MRINVEWSGKIFDTDQSVTAEFEIQWRLLGLGSCVTITLSHFAGADLQDCQSPYIRENNEREMNKTITACMQSYKPICPTTDQYRSIARFLQIVCTGKVHLHG